jgi:phospholipid/cholesterol/gamma-HCH transport system substrate-binding protein
MKRMAAVLVMAALAMTGCSFGGATDAPTYRAEFIRAIQIFPAVKVRVLGVDVGRVTSVKNAAGGVMVTFRVTRTDIKLPADVQAAVVPMSLLGERYIQLFPAYQGGPTLRAGATIPPSRTAVPAEPDELLRSLQDYLGGINSDTVTNFVENAAQALQGNGDQLNSLIENAADVLGTLSSKREDLAGLIVELNKLTVALSTRQRAIAQLIQNYGAVTGTLNTNRAALEGTITGLNQAAIQLASLLVDHRTALHADIKSLTRSTRTLSRNANSLARTGHWATRLFLAASRAVDYSHDWLRLGNQGQELGALILMRLEERLIDLCQQLGSPNCSTPTFWSAKVPQLFCFTAVCLPPKASAPTAAMQLAAAFTGIPQLDRALSKRAFQQGTTTQILIDALLDQTVGSPWSFAGVLAQ